MRGKAQKIIAAMLLCVFLSGQISPGFTSDNSSTLAASLVSDNKINPERSLRGKNDIAHELEPGAIGNGAPLLNLIHGKLPLKIEHCDEAVFKKLRKAIRVAIESHLFRRRRSSPQHQARAEKALQNLIDLEANLTKRAHIFYAVVQGPEDYLLGFNFQDKIGLSVELVNMLYAISPARLAQYIYHECVPEKGMADERQDHRIVYREIQTTIFGEDEVAALGKDLREYVDRATNNAGKVVQFDTGSIDTACELIAKGLGLGKYAGEINRIFYGTAENRMACKKELYSKGGTSVDMLRVGNIFLIEPAAYSGISGETLRRAEGLGAKVLISPELAKIGEDTAQLGIWTNTVMAAMQSADVKGKYVVDIGSGEGVLASVALKLGASSVDLIENDAAWRRKARNQMALNGFEAKDYRIYEDSASDLNNTGELAKRILSNLGEKRDIVIVSNVGYWPDYAVSNYNSIELIGKLLAIRHDLTITFIAGGYADLVWRRERRRPPIYKDLEALDRMGFGDNAIYAVAFNMFDTISAFAVTKTRFSRGSYNKANENNYDRMVERGVEDREPIAALDNKVFVDHRTGTIDTRPTFLGPKAGFNLWVARHGETIGNALKVLQGRLDVPVINQLSEAGREQAMKTAEALFENLENDIRSGEEVVVVTSTLSRSKETAQAFLDLVKDRTGVSLASVAEADADEISFGMCGNTPYEAPSDGVIKELAKYGVKTEVMSPSDDEVRRKWMGGDADIKFKGGESFIDVLVRSKRLLEKLNELYKGKTVVLIGHGTQLNAVRVLLGKDLTLEKDTSGRDHVNWRAMELKNSECKKLSDGADWSGVADLDGKVLVNRRTGQIKFAENAGPVLHLDYELWSMRHGASFGNTQDVLQGATNVVGINDLSPEGVEAARVGAQELFGQLGEEKIRSGDVVFVVSGLIRSRQTADEFINLVKEKLGIAINVVMDERANEMSFGDWANSPRTLFKKGGDPDKVAWHKKWKDEINAAVKAPNGETFIDVIRRNKALLESFNRLYKGKTVVVFDHGTCITAKRVLLGDETLINKDGVIEWQKTNFAPAEIRNLTGVSYGSSVSATKAGILLDKLFNDISQWEAGDWAPNILLVKMQNIYGSREVERRAIFELLEMMSGRSSGGDEYKKFAEFAANQLFRNAVPEPAKRYRILCALAERNKENTARALATLLDKTNTVEAMKAAVKDYHSSIFDAEDGDSRRPTFLDDIDNELERTLSPVKPPLQLLVFDMDLTLYASEGLTKALEEAFYQFTQKELSISPDEIMATRKRLNSMTGTLKEYELDLNEFYDYLAKNVDPSQYLAPDPRLRTLLERLAKKYHLAIATNNGNLLTRATLKALGIDDIFELVMTQQDAGKGKPEPRMFEMACKHFGVEPAYAVSIGDRKDIDLDTAAKIGMAGILVKGPEDLIANLESGIKAVEDRIASAARVPSSVNDLLYQSAVTRENISPDSELYRISRDIVSGAVEAAFLLKKFIKEQKTLLIDQKADKSLVTPADTLLNTALRTKFEAMGIPVIGEESEHRLDVINSGNYIAVDPIDGTSNFVSSFNGEKKDAMDHVTLISLVRNGVPVIGVCLNHLTGELDVAINSGSQKFESHINTGPETALLFTGQPVSGRIAILKSKRALIMGGKAKDPVNQAYAGTEPTALVGGLGCRIIALCDKSLESGLVYHKSQAAGVWDVAAPCVFASLNGVSVYDGDGRPVDFTKAAYIPGNGAIATKGDALGYAVNGILSEERAGAAGIEAGISAALPVRAEVFRATLIRILAEHPDELFFMGIEDDIGQSQKAQMMPVYKAIDEIEALKDSKGNKLFPNLMVNKGSAAALVATVERLRDERRLSLNNAFIGARKLSVDGKAFEKIEGEGRAWITAIDDSREGNYLPVFEAVTLNMLAYANADLAAIKDFYDAISDAPIDPAALQEMVKNRVIYILPKMTKFNTKELRGLYELAHQVYVSA